MNGDRESLRPDRTQCLALVLTAITVFSLMAMPAAASNGIAPADASAEAPPAGHIHEEQTDAPATTDNHPTAVIDNRLTAEQTPGDDVTIDENVTDSEGTVEVLVSLEDVDRASLRGQRTGSITEELKTHAERTQEPIVDYAEETDGVVLRNRFWIANAVVLEVDLTRANIHELARQPAVERIDKNYEVKLPEPASTNDTAETTYGLDQINATEVWDAYDTKGDGAEIAVLDTGVDPDHPDIDITEDNWAEFDQHGNIVESEPHETHYHGTHTSGTVVGGNASGEYIGVAPEATLMHGLVIPEGSGSIAQIIGGIEWAVEEDADAVSMSLGAADYIPDFIEVHRNANAAGTVVIASSGNDGPQSSSSPGNDYESLAVGASDEDGDIASFSSGEQIDTSLAWGDSAPDYWPEEYVVPDVAAPGVGVKSAEPGGGYQQLSGTSMAAPHVAGATALIVSAADDPAVSDIEAALTASAWKPAGEPEEKDTRYGHGIINAKTATDRLAADRGVTGTVTDGDGTPIEDASVSLATGFRTTTDENGEYTIGGTEDVMNVTVEKFGYETESASVNVSGAGFVTRNFTLEDTVDVRLVGNRPAGAIAGENTTFEFETANVESVTVDVSGDLSGSDATLYVDGEPVDFGEPHEFDGPVDEVAFDLWVSASASGTFSLEFSFDGADDSVTRSIEDLEVFEDTYDVGVVDTPDNEFGFVLAQELDSILPANYEISFVPTDEVMERIDEYDTFAVQRFGNADPGPWPGNYSLAERFYEETSDPSTGVVYLDQYGPWSGSIHEVSQATGHPIIADQKWWAHNLSAPLTHTVYDVQADHPILDGVAEEGDVVQLYDSVFTGEMSWFEETNANTIAEVGWQGLEPEGEGLAVDSLRDTVYAASMGRTVAYHDSGYSDYSEQADQILANSIKYVSGDAPMSIARGQPDQLGAGESISVEFDVENLDRIAVDLDEERSTVTEDNLTLYVDGKINAFDTYRGYESKTGTVNVTVIPDGPVQGKVALEHELVTTNGQRQSGGTGPTALYDAPIRVPQDVETIQDAIDLATGDEEIIVDDGTYTEQIKVRDGGMDGLTIRAAENATPTLELPDDPVERWAFNLQTDDQKPVVYVRHTDDVTISGFEIDAGGEVGVFPSDVHNVTFTDLHVTNASTAVWPDFYAIRTTVANSTITDSGRGIFAFWSNDNSVFENNTISDVDLGIGTDHVIDGVDVVDNEVTNATNAYMINGGDGRLDNNTARNVYRGLYLLTSGSVSSMDDNVVENATWGIVDASVNVPAEVTGNTIEADTGVWSEDWNLPDYHFNDFAKTDIVNDAPDYVDSRMNYIGNRSGQEPIVDGPVDYEPYLTAEPDDVSGWGTPEIGVDVHLDAGDTYAVGVPGPTHQTVGDIVDSDAEGVIYRFDADSQSWEQATANDTVGALDVLVVVAETDTRLAFEFQSGDAPPTPGQAELEEGWNLVAAPQYTHAEDAFDEGTFEPSLLQDLFASPDGQLGPKGDVEGTYTFGAADEGPMLSPFEGYFVFAEEAGTQPAYLAADAGVDILYESLGLDSSLSPAPDGDSSDAMTVDEVLEADTQSDTAAPGTSAEDRVHNALVDVIAGELQSELSGLPQNATATDELAAIQTAADEIVADAPEEDTALVGEATEDAVERVVAEEFGTNIAHHDVWEFEANESNDSTAMLAPVVAAG